MSRLIILGNGFDLHYDLPTQYKNHLVPILKRNNEDFFKIVDSIYFQGKPDLWSDFEGEIGDIKNDDRLHEIFIDNLYNVFSIQPDYYPYGSENFGANWIAEENAAYEASKLTPNFSTAFQENNQELLEEAFTFLEEGLREMCYEAEDKLEAKINANLIEKDFDFREDDSFITFNYTNTLEQIYAFLPKSNICHIHGLLEDDEYLVFGNDKGKITPWICNVYEENPNISIDGIETAETTFEEEYIRSVNFEEEDFTEYNMEASKLIDKFNKKFVKQLRLDLINDFLSQKTVNEVWVFGTSIGEVDIPYFSYIKSKYPLAKWWVSYYGKEEYSRISSIMDSILGSNVDYLSADEFLKKI